MTGVEALEKVGQILNKGKEQREELRALDAEFQKYKLQWQLEMESIKMETGLEELRLEVEDRSNARSREVEFMKASGGKRDWLMGVVVITGLLMTVGVVACLVFIRIPEENQRLADMTQAQADAVDNNLMRQSDARMPIFNERKSTTSFGKGT